MSGDSKYNITNSQKIEITNSIFSLCIGDIYYCGSRKLIIESDDQIPVEDETD